MAKLIKCAPETMLESNGFYLRIKCNVTQQELEITQLKDLLDMSNAERTKSNATISVKDKEIEELILRCKIQQ